MKYYTVRMPKCPAECFVKVAVLATGPAWCFLLKEGTVSHTRMKKGLTERYERIWMLLVEVFFPLYSLVTGPIFSKRKRKKESTK